jgi:hypothetical protein
MAVRPTIYEILGRPFVFAKVHIPIHLHISLCVCL